jgi:hypothetical protein
MVNNPLATLWVGKATIYEYQEITDPDTYETTSGLVPVVKDEPCRLSQNRVSHNQSDVVGVTNVPYVNQLIVLFIRPDLEIKAGSVIEVTQNNVTEKYKRSGKPAIYSNHQEITLELYEDKA